MSAEDSATPSGPIHRHPRRATDSAPLYFDVPEWMEQGICAQTDPEAFFPDEGGSAARAKRICMTCPVRDECLQYALDRHERFGLWGGKSARERRAMSKASEAA